MCISATASINAFIVNLISAICLVRFGNENLKTINYIIAIFSVFTSLMQLVDLGMWLDLDCKSGLNKFATLIGPVLTYLQPVAMFVIAYIIMNYTNNGLEKQATDIAPLEQKSRLFDMLSITSNKFNLGKTMNLVAFIILVVLLIRYYLSTHNTSCTTFKGSHLKWGWLSTTNPDATIYIILYGVVGIANFLLIDPSSIFIKIAIFGYISLYLISRFINKYYTGELWCLLSNMLPLLLLVIQKLFKNQIRS